MSFISLQEFQRLSGISDAVLVHLLCSNKLRCSLDPAGSLLVDVDDPRLAEVMTGITGLSCEILRGRQVLIAERVAAVIRDELGHILEDALALAASRARGRAESS